MGRNIAKILEGDLCSGCGGCAGIAPGFAAMEYSADGHLRPRFQRVLPERLDQKIAQICPGNRVMRPEGAPKMHPVWGPYLSTPYVGWARDAGLRHSGASGGALSGFLAHLIRSGTVDAVLQIGMNGTDPLGNESRVSENQNDIERAAGSRYAPAAPLVAVPQALESGKSYAFVGKPCDVAALRAWRDTDPKLAKTFPVLVSFFCAGTPSRHGGDEILRQMGMFPKEVSAFRFRGHGWPGNATAVDGQGARKTMSYAQSWGDILSKHVQFRCKICADGCGMSADIVFADAWKTSREGYPCFEDLPGESLIMVRTALGDRLLTEACQHGHLHRDAFDIEKIAAIQPGQMRRHRVLAARLAALRLLGRAVPRYDGFPVFQAAYGAKFPELARNFLGMLRRDIKRRLAKRVSRC